MCVYVCVQCYWKLLVSAETELPQLERVSVHETGEWERCGEKHWVAPCVGATAVSPLPTRCFFVGGHRVVALVVVSREGGREGGRE